MVSPEELFQQGKDYLEQGEYLLAYEQFQQLVELENNNFTALYFLGVALYCLEDDSEAIDSLTRSWQLNPSYEEAITYCDKVIEIQPDKHEAWHNRCIALFQLGRYEEAITACDKVIEIQPDDYYAWVNRGIALRNLGQYEDAIASYDKAIQIRPDYHDAWYNRGLALSNLGRYEEAIASYNKTLEIKLDLYKVWNIRGAILCDYLGRYEEAIDSFEKALEIKPNYHEAWYNRGNALSNLERYGEAITSYEKAIEIQPDYHEAWYNRGGAFSNLGRYKEAIFSFDKALEIKPDYHDIWYSRGLALSNLGRYEEAIASYDKALEIKPNSYDVWYYHETWYNRGIVLCNLERYEEAIFSFDKALEIQPDYHDVWYSRGIALSNLGQYEEAIAAYDQAIEIQPDYYHPWNGRGNVLDKLKRYEEAIAAYDQAIKIQPDYHYAWNGRSNVLSKWEQYEEAIAAYDQALEIQPDYHYAWNSRGIALSALGRYEEAIYAYDQALEIQPDYHYAWNSRGGALSHLGQYEEAIAAYDQALEIKPSYYPAWANRGLAAGDSRGYIPFLHTQQLNSELNKRGYPGELASYRAGLEFIHQDTHPEGWEFLHHKIGKAHYFRGRQKAESGLGSSRHFWEQAKESYDTALKTLQPPEFVELHLEVLKDLVRVLLNLNEVQEAQEIGRRGTDVLNKELEDPKRTERSKRKLALKFASFQQLTVDIKVQSGNLIEALILAEKGKNVCLKWLLKIDEVSEAKLTKIQSLLNNTTAAVYWHLSPAALTTFILKSNCPTPILISHPRENSELSEAAQRLIEFEDWMEEWDEQYSDYRQQSKNKQNKDHPWKNEMQQRLFERQEQPGNLKDILNIAEIERHLVGIENLILMPHQDLHRFPLHALFSSQFTVTYLPSFQMGIMIKNRKINPNKTLLCVENPTQDLGFARVEAEGIAQYFEQVQPIREKTATKKRLKNYIDKNCSVFHFAGHAEHVSENPQQSRLKLADDDQNQEEPQNLILADLPDNAFSSYDLVTLSACETAITNNQSITSEYVGLVSGFLRSGAAQVVSTLWTVESAASALVMIEFYRQRTLGKSNSKALAAAVHWLRNLTAKDLQQWRDNFLANLSREDRKRKTLIEQSLDGEKWATIEPETKVYDSPYYWAAFIISGQVT